MSINNKDLTITGNLRIVNGLGATNGLPNDPYNLTAQTVNGLGNLIIGYNHLRNVNSPDVVPDTRTGSHNLILGDYNNYTSIGGIVGGAYNMIGGHWSSILGGQNNTTEGAFSAISGGDYNLAAGVHSSVSGGAYNHAVADWTSVTGGHHNESWGKYSSISGGASNYTAGVSSSVTGGYGNSADGDTSTVTGGESNWAYGVSSAISGGKCIKSSNPLNWAAGGVNPGHGVYGVGVFQY